MRPRFQHVRVLRLGFWAGDRDVVVALPKLIGVNAGMAAQSPVSLTACETGEEEEEGNEERRERRSMLGRTNSARSATRRRRRCGAASSEAS